MKISKSYIFLFMIILLCVPLVKAAKAEDKIEQTYTFGRDGKVYLEAQAGDIVVNSWEKNEIKIIAHEDATINILQTDGNIRIMIKRHKSSDCELFIPDKAHLRVKTERGKVKAREIGGFLDIRTVRGDIVVVSAQNGVRCKTVRDDIYLKDITGNADLKTTSGEISITDVNGSVRRKP